jgi:hypothetical protein
MKLGTHEERLAALENAADSANPLELVHLVQLAAQLDREATYLANPVNANGAAQTRSYN